MTTQSLPGRLLALLLAILLVLPSTAWADDAAAAAAEYYNQATAAYQQGDYQKAADLLDLAFGSDPDLVYKYNRILALQALGDYSTALAELNTMLGPMRADRDKRFEDVDQIKAQLEAAITSKEQANPDDPPDDPPDPIEPGDSPEKKGPNILAISLVGGGGAMLLTGVLFSTAVFLPADIKECAGVSDTPDCRSLREESEFEDDADANEYARSVQKTHVIAAVSLMAAGTIAAAVGVVLLVLDGGDDSAPPASAGLDSLQLLPTFSSDGMGAALQMRF